MKCPKCNHEISDKAIAKHLASKGGKAKKVYSPEAKKARAATLAKARKKRWPKKGGAG